MTDRDRAADGATVAGGRTDATISGLAVAGPPRDPDPRLLRRMERAFVTYGDRPALGSRTAKIVTDPTTGRTTRELGEGFAVITYHELWARVTALSADLRAADGWPEGRAPLAPGDMAGILGFSSADYAVVELACLHAGAVCVPLQSSATAQMLPVLAETQPCVLATSTELLGVAVDCALATPSIRRIIVTGYHGAIDDDHEALTAARGRLAENGSDAVVEVLDDVIERGRTRPPLPAATSDEDDPLMLLLYTSGSTGEPKGAMYPEHLLATMWDDQRSVAGEVPPTSFNYMPMSHLIGQVLLLSTLGAGGTVCHTARPDLSSLFADLALAAPTDLVLVPRVCDTLRQRYTAELHRRAADREPTDKLRGEVLAGIRRDVLGGQVLRAYVGTAPISAEMHEFLRELFGTEVFDSYGSTEAGTILVNQRIQSPPVIEWKLRDVPELGYTAADTPHPRGELLVRTATIIPGYYRRPEATAEVFDDAGFYRTGDIMAFVGPAELHYVDRVKNVLKLSQGEFVAVSRLESCFVAAEGVRQIFLFGSSKRSYLLAVVVPTEEALAGSNLSGPGSAQRLRGTLLASPRAVAVERGLAAYEVPREIVVETEPFTTENGLLSDARKPLRRQLIKRYGEQLEQLYRQLASAQNDARLALASHGRDRSVPDTVAEVAQAILETTEAPPLDARFLDLGGDSLTALSFSQLLGEVFGVRIPVGEIVSPTADLAGIAAAVEARLAGTTRPTAGSVHGADTATVRAADLTLEKFIEPTLVRRARSLPRATGTPTTVLLTGANGYLGRFLALQWLERLAETGGTLIALVRGHDDAEARARLEQAIDSGDPDLLQRFHRLATDHLEVRAADIAEPDLGLSSELWSRLATEVDLIVHPAALVNHLLPYDQLFGPNVLGVAELIKLALTERITPITYLSTTAVVSPQTGDPAEANDVRVTIPRRALNGGYAEGYATSKWAGEVLLREAHDAVGLPVTVFRCDLIMAHSAYARQLNVPDVLTRMLLSVAATGLAPRTFYTRPDGWPADETGRPRAHFGGLPVDFIAEAVTVLGEQDTAPGNAPGFRTFHVINPHDDGISLDVLIDWLADAGLVITRIDDYTAWATRFRAALEALPAHQRKASVLPLMHAFDTPSAPVAGSFVPAGDFRAAVRAARIGPDKDIPHLNAALVHKYVADLRRVGLL